MGDPLPFLRAKDAAALRVESATAPHGHAVPTLVHVAGGAMLHVPEILWIDRQTLFR